ncbi:hypothetical protein GCM10009785_22890 [Brooklawnia cerclae]
MASQVYKTLLKIVGLVLLVIGIGALIGGSFAHSYVKDQLSEQAIAMPTNETLDAQVKSGRLTQENADAMRPFAGEEMTTGPMAQAFANEYIASHMKAAAVALDVPDDKATYEGVGELVTEKTSALTEVLKAEPENADKTDAEISALATKEIANANTTYQDAKDAAALQTLRTGTMFTGNSLRGMLLNAYGWWLLGTIAIVAAWALIVIGVASVVVGFVWKPKSATASAPATE